MHILLHMKCLKVRYVKSAKFHRKKKKNQYEAQLTFKTREKFLVFARENSLNNGKCDHLKLKLCHPLT